MRCVNVHVGLHVQRRPMNAFIAELIGNPTRNPPSTQRSFPMRRPHDEPYRSPFFGVVEKLALLGALGLILSPAIKGIRYRWRVKNPVATGEAAVDESLQDTFPASDPPASRFFDIPENRKE